MLQEWLLLLSRGCVLGEQVIDIRRKSAARSYNWEHAGLSLRLISRVIRPRPRPKISFFSDVVVISGFPAVSELNPRVLKRRGRAGFVCLDICTMPTIYRRQPVASWCGPQMSTLFDSFSRLFLASFETDHALFDRFFLNPVPSSAIP